MRSGGPGAATARFTLFAAIKRDPGIADTPIGVKTQTKRMSLRPPFASTRSASRLLLLALVLLTLGPGSNNIDAGVTDYASTLYLSGAASGVPGLGGSYRL